MASEPITTGPETLLDEAARILGEHKIGCLPVVESGRLIGIITEADFVAWWRARRDDPPRAGLSPGPVLKGRALRHALGLTCTEHRHHVSGEALQ